MGFRFSGIGKCFAKGVNTPEVTLPYSTFPIFISCLDLRRVRYGIMFSNFLVGLADVSSSCYTSSLLSFVEIALDLSVSGSGFSVRF